MRLMLLRLRTRLGRFDKAQIVFRVDHINCRRCAIIRTIVAVAAPVITVIAGITVAIVAVVTVITRLARLVVVLLVVVLLVAGIVLLGLLGPVAVLARVSILATLPLRLAALAILLLPRILLSSHLAGRLGQHTGVMLGVLVKVFSGDTVIRQLCIAGEKLVFLDDLLRRAAHLAFGAGTVEHTVDDISDGAWTVRL